MKRRTSTLPVRVYTYHCHAPTQNAAIVDQQMYLARLYRDRLIEIELTRRRRYREIAQNADALELRTQILECEARLRELRVKHARDRSRARRVRAPVLGDALVRDRAERAMQMKLLRAELKTLRERAAAERALRSKTDPIVSAAIRALDEEAHAAAKQARGESGVFWGTYLLVEAAVEAARRSHADPRFGRRDGGGRIGVQIQGGASVRDVLAGRCQWLQIDPLPTTQWQTRSGCRKARTAVRIRVGTDEHRRAIWASFPMKMHRPLPEDAVIKTAAVLRRSVARRYEYELQVTLEAPSMRRQPPRSTAVAAVHVGWRWRPEGLRVGMLVDEQGRERELLLPRSFFAWLEQSDQLRETRARALNHVLPQLVDGLLAMPDRPEWLTEDLKTMAQWHSPDRLAYFVQRWSDHWKKTGVPRPDRAGDLRSVARSALRNVPHQPLPLPRRTRVSNYEPPPPIWNERTRRVLGGMHRVAERDARESGSNYMLDVIAVDLSPMDELYVMARCWRGQDAHLMRWQTYGAQRALRWRRETYRRFAAELAGAYRLLVMDKFDLRAGRVGRATDGADAVIERVTRYRAGISTLRLAIAHRNAVEMMSGSAADKTRCHACGALQRFERAALHAAALMHTCTACGSRWDPDVNAARDLLRRYQREHRPSLEPEHDSVGGE